MALIQGQRSPARARVPAVPKVESLPVNRSIRPFFLLLPACGLAGLSPPVTAGTLNVTVETGALSGVAAQLAFDLVDGDGAANNAVTITAFASDGALGSATPLGGVTGSLPGPVTIDDTGFFNERL